MREVSQRLATIFVRNVRERMDELEINQLELARRMKKSQSFVSNMLAGRRHPGLESLENFAKALRVEPAELIKEKNFSEIA